MTSYGRSSGLEILLNLVHTCIGSEPLSHRKNHKWSGRDLWNRRSLNFDSLDLNHYREEWKGYWVHDCYRIARSEWKEPSIGVLESRIAISHNPRTIPSRLLEHYVIAPFHVKLPTMVADSAFAYSTILWKVSIDNVALFLWNEKVVTVYFVALFLWNEKYATFYFVFKNVVSSF